MSEEKPIQVSEDANKALEKNESNDKLRSTSFPALLHGCLQSYLNLLTCSRAILHGASKMCILLNRNIYKRVFYSNFSVSF